MNKLVKKTVIVLLLGSFIVGIGILPVAAMAEEVVVPSSLSLEESIEYAVANSESLRLMEDNIDLKEDALDEATDDYWDYKSGDLSGANFSNLEKAKVNNQYYVIQAQADYDEAVSDYEEAVEQITYDATKHYYNLLLAEENLESAKISYESAQEDLDLVNLQYKLGDATSLHVTLATNRRTEAENTVMTNQENLELKEMQWKLFLGLAYNQEIQIEGTWDALVLPDVESLADPALFEELVNADSSVVQANSNYELQTIAYETFVNIYHKVNKDYEKYLYQYEQSTYSYNQAVNQAWMKVYSDYYSLLQQERSYLENETTLVYTESLSELEALKYSVGETSLVDLLDAEEDLYDAILKNNQQKVNLMLEALSWQNEYQ